MSNQKLRTQSQFRFGAFIFLTMLFSCAVTSHARETDLHWLWHNNCADCHGHSAEFSRQFLTVTDGELQGRHHRQNLRRFLGNHYLPTKQVDSIYGMLLAQVKTPPRYKNECRGCHKAAVELVRNSLEYKEELLVLRRNKTQLHEFLGRHSGLSLEGAAFYTELLNRIADEVGL